MALTAFADPPSSTILVEIQDQVNDETGTIVVIEIIVPKSRRLPEGELTAILYIQAILLLTQSIVGRRLLRRDLISKFLVTNILAL